MTALSFNEYQAFCASTAVYPDAGTGEPIAIVYCVLGACSEAGEAAGHAKKMLRDDNGVITHDRRLAMLRELGDNLWYIARGAEELGMTLEELAQMNITKLAQRKVAGTLHGGDETRVRQYEIEREGGGYIPPIEEGDARLRG